MSKGRSFISQKKEEDFWLGGDGDDSDSDMDSYHLEAQGPEGDSWNRKAKEKSTDWEGRDLMDPWEKKWDAKFAKLYSQMPFKKPARKTDAVLSCPGCFSVVCEMCRQDEGAPFNEWIAQEVTENCLKSHLTNDEGHYTIHCKQCHADLGSFSPDEGYHFDSVIPSVY
eukprot:TRINITY_DN12527_c0_g1_i1.p1 TRINITY_DN12527_c0_g1~~TRINITY_DN12527_c0_g1_i1.p1  ORF type:complete len:176 (-),score=37.76 TRINITY_DN12527_c0_g1_i1:178-681(-)